MQADKVTAAAPGGDVDRLFIAPTGGIQWENFDEAVTQLAVTVESKYHGDDSYSTDASQTFDLGGDVAGKSGEWTWDGGAQMTLMQGKATSRLDVEKDGATASSTVDVRITAGLLGGDGEKCDPAGEASVVLNWTLPVEVTNKPASAGGSGSLNGGAET